MFSNILQINKKEKRKTRKNLFRFIYIFNSLILRKLRKKNVNRQVATGKEFHVLVEEIKNA